MNTQDRLLEAEAATLSRLLFSLDVKLDDAYAAAARAKNINALDIACADIVRLSKERRRLAARQQEVAAVIL